jgi:hypothetical protein
MENNPPVPYARVPERLQTAGYRFIRLYPLTKEPLGKGWADDKNYTSDSQTLREWLETPMGTLRGKGPTVYGNYGVLCSSSRIVIDLDNKETIDHALSLPDLEKTYSVQSGSGRGLHLYLKTDLAKIVPLWNPENREENVGHIKAKGSYVVGPFCVHPSGGNYRVINDSEIEYVGFSTLLKHFEGYHNRKEYTGEKSKKPSGRNEIDIPIDRVWYPGDGKRNGNEIQGSHPIHGSTGGKNFCINIRENNWFCHRHQTGGGVALAIAVSHGLIDCQDATPGCLRGDVFKEVLAIAEEEYGWISEKQKRSIEGRKIRDVVWGNRT